MAHIADVFFSIRAEEKARQLNVRRKAEQSSRHAQIFDALFARKTLPKPQKVLLTFGNGFGGAGRKGKGVRRSGVEQQGLLTAAHARPNLEVGAVVVNEKWTSQMDPSALRRAQAGGMNKLLSTQFADGSTAHCLKQAPSSHPVLPPGLQTSPLTGNARSSVSIFPVLHRDEIGAQTTIQKAVFAAVTGRDLYENGPDDKGEEKEDTSITGTSAATAHAAGPPSTSNSVVAEGEGAHYGAKTGTPADVTPMNVDFLSLETDDPKLKNVSHILVDPSCSGSGIPSRLDHLIPSAPEAEQLQRIKALSNFQLAIVSHALRFSGVKRVVYSTCSVWEQEDEGVVMRVLARKDFQEAGWRLAPREEVLPGWERRGRVAACGGDESIADSLVRCLPEDGTNGFFVACFVKDESLPPISVILPVITAPTPEDVTIVDVDVEAPAVGAGAGAGKSGKKDKKTKSSGNQAARRAKAETLGTLGILSTATPTTTVTEKKKAAPTPKAMAIAEANEEDWEDEPAAVEKKEETGKKLSKKQMYLLKKEEVKRKKAAAAGGK
ncbi:hypothetical protein JCM11641_006906 [Rhodosporidiobolus odoratus]